MKLYKNKHQQVITPLGVGEINSLREKKIFKVKFNFGFGYLHKFYIKVIKHKKKEKGKFYFN
jgi:hypothetical protein